MLVAVLFAIRMNVRVRWRYFISWIEKISSFCDHHSLTCSVMWNKLIFSIELRLTIWSWTWRPAIESYTYYCAMAWRIKVVLAVVYDSKSSRGVRLSFAPKISQSNKKSLPEYMRYKLNQNLSPDILFDIHAETQKQFHYNYVNFVSIRRFKQFVS